jgi:class 3 adenylate cyclase
MLGVLHLQARRLFAPIAAALAAGKGIGPAERALTQLPLRSAAAAGLLYAATMSARILPPLLLDGATLFGQVPPETRPTPLDAGMTVLVSAGFMFVVVYFVVSDYLERLCARIFAATGANLSLFYGRFGTKLGFALVFAALAPVLLVAKDVVSYDGARLEQALMLDISVSLFGISALVWWATRTLGRPIARLDEGMRRAAEGDLSVRLPVTSNEEIGALTFRFNRMVEGLAERARLRETFGKFVDENVAAALLRDAPDGRLPGRTETATLLFTDIEGFTRLAEDMPPDDVIALLNAYLPRVVEPIRRHGGTVNGFAGDGLFASFNVPLALPDHAARAVAAARAIQAELADFRTRDGRALVTRIGLNTGPVVAGTIGAGERLSYTLLGDAVNAAARLEALNKQHGTRILAGETTFAAAGAGPEFRLVGEAALRGRTGTMRVYAVG